MWSYERDGRWWGWSFVRGSTVLLYDYYGTIFQQQQNFRVRSSHFQSYLGFSDFLKLKYENEKHVSKRQHCDSHWCTLYLAFEYRQLVDHAVEHGRHIPDRSVASLQTLLQLRSGGLHPRHLPIHHLLGCPETLVQDLIRHLQYHKRLGYYSLILTILYTIIIDNQKLGSCSIKGPVKIN